MGSITTSGSHFPEQLLILLRSIQLVFDIFPASRNKKSTTWVLYVFNCIQLQSLAFSCRYRTVIMMIPAQIVGPNRSQVVVPISSRQIEALEEKRNDGPVELQIHIAAVGSIETEKNLRNHQLQ